jgi:flavin-dependent dehydrogenase
VESGATFALGQIDGLTVSDDATITASARVPGGIVRARLGIVATGAHIGLIRRLGAVYFVKPSAIAGRSYIQSSVDLDRIILSYDRSIVPGYGWIVPLGNNMYNVGCGFFLGESRLRNLRQCFDAFVSQFPLARNLLDNGHIVSPLRAAPLRCGLRGVAVRVDRSILIAGETIGTTFPLTGEGIGQAMRTGELAAAAVGAVLENGEREHLKEYSMAIESHLRSRHDGFEYAQKWVSRPWLNDFMARRVKRSDYLQEACSRFIADSGDPRIIYSLPAVLKSFWK